MPDNQYAYRSIPAMDKCLSALLSADGSLAQIPRTLLKNLINAFWDEKRSEIKKGKTSAPLSLELQLPYLLAHVRSNARPSLRPVLNATGVIIHTNLGRSILAESACEAVLRAAKHYCNLEMDLESGERGSRQALVNNLLCALTGAEDALVVNNNAAAVLLLLDTLCAGGETIVSRGELVEIGGSFRIPDIMQKSGTVLIEVGTTNRTHLKDYEQAITPDTKAIMVVHASNFRIIGFHAAVDLKNLAMLAHENSLPLLMDLGSGNLLNFSENGLPPEPTVQDALEQGADLVCFSGDKALGGPQAGIIVGKTVLMEKMKKNPLARALRCDKLCLAALEATLRLYLDPQQAQTAIPTPAMIGLSSGQLAKNARTLATGLRRAFQKEGIACQIKTREDFSQVGGGSFPEWGLATTLVCLRSDNIPPGILRKKLLAGDIPIVGRLEKDAFCLDPRTIAKKDYPLIIKALLNAFRK